MVEWRSIGRAPTRPAAPDLSGEGRGYHTGSGGAGSDPHVGVLPGNNGAGQSGAIPERAVVTPVARRVSRTAEALLGATPMGAGLLLRERGCGRRGHNQEVHREPEMG